MDKEIRHASPTDLSRIMQIYAHARQFMAEHGNPRQWGATNWPPEDLIRRDIQAGRSYVCTVDERVVGVFCYLFGENPEPVYRSIDGEWKTNAPYGVVHRMASGVSFEYRSLTNQKKNSRAVLAKQDRLNRDSNSASKDTNQPNSCRISSAYSPFSVETILVFHSLFFKIKSAGRYATQCHISRRTHVTGKDNIL